MDKYTDWIKTHLDMNCTGKCKEYTELMLRAFPELQLVRGHYYCVAWGRREHWWLKDIDGNIIDPTKSQFPTKGYGVYEEWDESLEEPTGKCPNCGSHVYNHKTFCNDICHDEFMASLNIGAF